MISFVVFKKDQFSWLQIFRGNEKTFFSLRAASQQNKKTKKNAQFKLSQNFPFLSFTFTPSFWLAGLLVLHSFSCETLTSNLKAEASAGERRQRILKKNISRVPRVLLHSQPLRSFYRVLVFQLYYYYGEERSKNCREWGNRVNWFLCFRRVCLFVIMQVNVPSRYHNQFTKLRLRVFFFFLSCEDERIEHCKMALLPRDGFVRIQRTRRWSQAERNFL